MKFTAEDVAFMDSLNNTGEVSSNIYFTAKHAGYMRNLDRDKVKRLESIYKRVFDLPKFSLCYHCQNDVMKMVLKLYDAQAKQSIEPELTLQADPFLTSSPDPSPEKQDPGPDAIKKNRK